MKFEQSCRQRVRIHAALAEQHRLATIDELTHGHYAPSELQRSTGLRSNLLAHHLDVLEDAGSIARHRSQDDARRRYVRLRAEALDVLVPTTPVPDGLVLFVCTNNAARSQRAAALWRLRSRREAVSAGTAPAPEIDRFAQSVAADHHLDLGGRAPRSYDQITVRPDLVVSVCDRARESGLPWAVPQLHWSVPDPADGGRATFERAFVEIQERVGRLDGRRQMIPTRPLRM